MLQGNRPFGNMKGGFFQHCAGMKMRRVGKVVMGFIHPVGSQMQSIGVIMAHPPCVYFNGKSIFPNFMENDFNISRKFFPEVKDGN